MHASNDPHDYFQRLQSYSQQSSTTLSGDARPKYNKRHSRSQSHSPSKSRNYSPSNHRDYTPSPTTSKYRDYTPSPPKKTKPRDYTPSPPKPHAPTRPPSHARTDSYFSERPESYASLESYVSSRSHSYQDSEPLTLFSEKSEKSARREKRKRRYEHENPFENPKEKWWTRKRKIIVGLVLAIIGIILIIIIAVVVTNNQSGFKYTPSDVKVTNPKAFQAGGATNDSPDNKDDGIGMGQDVYHYYSGGPEQFPPSSKWVSFEQMWLTNLPNVQKACGWLKEGEDNTDAQNQDIFDAIQDRAKASLVDHRYILATILQESHGCVHVGETESSGGVTNPGLMQSHNGDSFDEKAQTKSILLMVQDGTQGTKHGDGLVQLLNIYGDPYSASRGYNSGYIPKSGNLSEASGATACYVSDIANRLTGWVNAESLCDPEST